MHSSDYLYEQAIDVAERWRYSFYDAMIIAAALITKCDLLYSEDLQQDKKFKAWKLLILLDKHPQNVIPATIRLCRLAVY